jgi:hypothetical protein
MELTDPLSIVRDQEEGEVLMTPAYFSQGVSSVG